MTSGWGAAEPEPEAWRHGPWTLTRCGDELADVAFGGRPVLRGIRAVVRDRGWRTVPPTVEGVERTDGGLRLLLRFTGLGADLRGALAVTADGRGLTAALVLRSLTVFERNRIGLVVLHPADVAGETLGVEHVDGTRSAGRFPATISPHQPAVDISALSWTAHGVRSRLALEGDVFEMEDQRNWTDASFKTYSTPLREPMPVLVSAGDEIRQTVRLTCERAGGDHPPRPSSPIELVRRDGRLPTFALGATTEPGPLPAADPADLLVELEAERPGWRAVLARAAEEAGTCGLDVRIVAERPETVREVVDELARQEARCVRFARTGVFSPATHLTEPAGWAALRDRVAEVGLSTQLVGGTRAHFTELNRGHADLPGDLPALAFSSTPQMHAVESRALVESIAMQRLTATEAVAIARGRPMHIGPVTLRPRFNAVATTPPAGPADATDPRQSSAALAAWLVASAAAFARPGVASVTFFEASGPRGLRSQGGTDFPVRGAARQVLGLSGAEAVDPVDPPAGMHVLAGVRDGRVVALAANLRDEPLTATLVLAGQEHRVTIPPLGLERVEWTFTRQPAAAEPAAVH